MFLIRLFLMVTCTTAGILGANITGNSSIFDDRININTNYGHAHAVGKDGSFSGSDASSVGFNAGILYPGNRYSPLASQTSSKSNSYSSGRRPPSTFTNTGVNNRGQYGIQGNVAAGYSGGVGQSFTKSQSQQFAIPLGFGGAVILSNLPETPPADQQKTEPSSNSPPTSSSVDPSPPVPTPNQRLTFD